MFIDCRHQQMSRTRAQLEAGTSLGPAASPLPPSAVRPNGLATAQIAPSDLLRHPPQHNITVHYPTTDN